MLLCMFSLFFIQPDMAYILAFLLALAVCCGDMFLENDRIFGTVCVFLCAAGLLIPALTLFSPAAGYGLFRRRIYIPAVLFIIVFFIRTAGMLPVLLLCLELFAFLISFFFAVEEAELEQLRQGAAPQRAGPSYEGQVALLQDS